MLMQSPTFQNLIIRPFEENSHCESLTAQANGLARQVALRNTQKSKSDTFSDAECVHIDSLFESMASFMTQRPPAPFVAAFARLIVLHVTENKLFYNVSKRLAGGVPDWWSQLCGCGKPSDVAGAVFSVWLHCAKKSTLTVAENSAFVASFADSFPKILHALRIETKKKATTGEEHSSRLQSGAFASKYSPAAAEMPSESSLIDFAALEAFVLKEETAELACFCILQSTRATQHILNSAEKEPTGPEALRGQRILEAIVVKSPLVHIAKCGSAPGASMIASKFYKQSDPAYSLASSMPTFFIGEFLCHGIGFDLFRFPVIPKSLEIAVLKIEALVHFDMSELYRLQNNKARSTSLLANVCDAAHLVSVNLMLSLGENPNNAGPFKTIFGYAKLPPIAKGNHYLSESDSTDVGNDQLKAQTLFASFVSGLGGLLRIMLPLIPKEIFVEEGPVSILTEEEKTKILQHRLEKVFAATFASMAALKASEDWPLCRMLKRDCVEILANVLECCRKKSSDLENDVFWLTLFNLANDLCYSDISLAPALLETLDLLLERINFEESNQLVLSALVQFYSTFDVGGQEYTTVGSMTEWEKGGQEMVTVPRSEYEFLFNEKDSLRAGNISSKRVNENAKKIEPASEGRSRQNSNGCKKSAVVDTK